jgi:predicted transcriptional regulator of viral defense system
MNWADRVAPFASRQNSLISAKQCAEAGISRDQVKHLCRTGEWRHVMRGVYQVWDFGRTHEVRAAMLASGERATVVLDSAARLFGLPLPGAEVVHLAVPGHSAVPRNVHNGGVVIHQRELTAGETTVVDGMRVTTPVRTVADLLLTYNRYAAVPAADAAILKGLLTDDDLARVERMLFRMRGAIKAREALEQVDGRAESPLESRGRLRCRDAGIAPGELQAEIKHADGQLIGRVDMLWPSFRLIAEADGAEFHDRPEALFHDRARQNALVSAGYAVVRFTWEDTLSAVRLPQMVRAAMHRR